MRRRKGRKWLIIPGVLVLLLAILVAVWDWDWFKPLVEARASAALGRPVTLGHLHVHLGNPVVVTADDVVVANPDGFPADPPFARAQHLAVAVDALAFLRSREVVLPSITLDHPVVEARQLPDGQANWRLGGGGGGGVSPRIGDLRIVDGQAHVVDPKLKADFNLAVSTREDPGQPARIVAEARGTYAGQPITGTFTGGALLSLRDKDHPYPVDLQLANGPTRLRLTGTVQDPLSFAGADVKATASGPDMSRLTPLIGIAIPETPPFEVTGMLDYERGSIRFRDFQGRVGHSDLAGTVAVDTTGQKPVVNADLSSKRVDLADLGGFIGATPGKRDAPGQDRQQKAEHAQAAASSRMLPDQPINLPKLRSADVHLKYRGARIEGRSTPLDNLVADVDIVDGKVTTHPVSFGIGRGAISANVTLADVGDHVQARADVQFQRVDVSRLLGAAGGRGAGTIGGRAVVEGGGKSFADILGTGNGDLKLFMVGGNLSAFLVDLSGLQFGNAVLSLAGIPSRTDVRCMVTDFALRNGQLQTRLGLLDTDEANVHITGGADLRQERLDFELRTEAKHFSIGSLPAPIDIGGTFKNPSVAPNAAVLAARGGAAVGLGILLTPLGALLPTIQLGLGENNDCDALIRQASSSPTPKAEPAEARGREPAPAQQRRTRRR